MELTTSWKTIDSYLWSRSSGVKITFYLEARYTTQDKTNNKTNVETRLRSEINNEQGYYLTGQGYKFTLSYATTRSGTGTWSFADETILTGKSPIAHGSDGKKSLTLKATVRTTRDNVVFEEELSATVDLPTIPRASTIACTSPNIGDTATITISRKTNFVDTLTYEIGTLTGVIEEKTTKDVVNFSTADLKEQIYALIPNDKKITGKIICTTYSGDTQIGDPTTADFNLYANEEECRPEVTATIVDTNETTLAFGKLVKHISKPKVTINATTKYGATIKSYSINLNDGQTSTLQEDTFDSIGSNSIVVNAIDSREYGNPQNIPLDIVDYVKLFIDSVELTRPEDVSNEVILNGSGAWFNDETINHLTISFKYKTSDVATWTNGGEITPSIEGNTFTFTNLSLGNNYDFNKEYQFKIIAADSFMTVGDEDKSAITVPKGIAIVEIGEDLVNVNGNLTISNEDGNNEVNVLEKLNTIPQEIIDTIYPIGSTYIMPTNTSPSSILGGTWELIDKDFAHYNGNATFTKSSSSSATLAFARNGKNIYCRLTFVNSATLDDNTVTVGNIDLASLGVTDLTYSKYPIGQTDGGGAILMMSVNNGTGVVTVNDVIDKGGTNKVSSGATCYVEWSNTINTSAMLDSACDKFYWKRTA